MLHDTFCAKYKLPIFYAFSNTAQPWFVMRLIQLYTPEWHIYIEFYIINWIGNLELFIVEIARCCNTLLKVCMLAHMWVYLM